MQSRLPMGVGVLLITVFAAGVHVAAAWEPGRLDMQAVSARQQVRGALSHFFRLDQSGKASLAARQDLQDEICIAKADGRITPEEYRQILSDANRVLPAEELASFKQYLDPMAFPPSRTVSNPAAIETVAAKAVEKATVKPVEKTAETKAETAVEQAAAEVSVEDSAEVTQTKAEVETAAPTVEKGVNRPAVQKMTKGLLPAVLRFHRSPQSDTPRTLTIPTASTEPDRMASLVDAR